MASTSFLCQWMSAATCTPLGNVKSDNVVPSKPTLLSMVFQVPPALSLANHSWINAYQFCLVSLLIVVNKKVNNQCLNKKSIKINNNKIPQVSKPQSIVHNFWFPLLNIYCDHYVFGTVLAQGQNLSQFSLMLKPGFLGSALFCLWKVDAHPLSKV